MTARHVALLIGVIVVGAGCGAPQPPRQSDTAADHTAVERAITQFFDSGIAVVDTSVVALAMTASAMVLEDSVWYDRAGFLQMVQSLPAVIGEPYTLRYTLSDWKTTVHGDVAWTSMRNHAVLTTQSRPPQNLDWRETVVLTKAADVWRIDRYHSAPMRP